MTSHVQHGGPSLAAPYAEASARCPLVKGVWRHCLAVAYALQFLIYVHSYLLHDDDDDDAEEEEEEEEE